MCRLWFLAIFAVAMAAAWPWPQAAIFPDQRRDQDRNAPSSPLSRPSAPQISPGNTSLPIDSGWLYRAMTQMAIDMHETIVTGDTIKSCGGAGSSPNSGEKLLIITFINRIQ